MYYIGFDIGGSNLKAVLVKNKKIIRSQVKILPNNFSALLKLAEEIIEDFKKELYINPGDIKGVGISVPGPLDKKREKILNTPNIKYLSNKPLKKILERRLKLPIKLEHDVHCFLLAEKKVGATKNLRNVFYITLGTGIGGAWMFDDKIYFGAHGSAGEIGHSPLQLSESCNGSEVLDLEDLASNKIFKKLTGKNAEEVFEMAEKGDKKAKEIFKIMGENLGVGLAGLVNILDPEIIILGGGIAKSEKFFLPFAKKTMRKYIISPLAKKEIKVVISKLHFAGALGATLLYL